MDIYTGNISNVKSDLRVINKRTFSESEINVKKFESMLVNKEVKGLEKKETLKEWINSLKELKKELEEETSRDNLEMYKKNIKEFINFYIEDNLELVNHHTKTGMFRTKEIQIVKTIDQNLDKLAEELLETQSGQLEILRITGQIQGLIFELVV